MQRVGECERQEGELIARVRLEHQVPLSDGGLEVPGVQRVGHVVVPSDDVVGVRVDELFAHAHGAAEVMYEHIGEGEVRETTLVKRVTRDERVESFDRLLIVASRRDVVRAERPVLFALGHAVEVFQRLSEARLGVVHPPEISIDGGHSRIGPAELRIARDRLAIGGQCGVDVACVGQLLAASVRAHSIKRRRSEGLSGDHLVHVGLRLAERDANTCGQHADGAEHLAVVLRIFGGRGHALACSRISGIDRHAEPVPSSVDRARDNHLEALPASDELGRFV